MSNRIEIYHDECADEYQVTMNFDGGYDNESFDRLVDAQAFAMEVKTDNTNAVVVGDSYLISGM